MVAPSTGRVKPFAVLAVTALCSTTSRLLRRGRGRRLRLRLRLGLRRRARRLGLSGARRGLLADRELQTGMDQRRIVADGLTVVVVEPLPASADILLVGDLRETVAGSHHIALHARSPHGHRLLRDGRGPTRERHFPKRTGHSPHGRRWPPEAGGRVRRRRLRQRRRNGRCAGSSVGGAYPSRAWRIPLRRLRGELSGADWRCPAIPKYDLTPSLFRRPEAGVRTCGSPAPAVYG